MGALLLQFGADLALPPSTLRIVSLGLEPADRYALKISAFRRHGDRNSSFLLSAVMANVARGLCCPVAEPCCPSPDGPSGIIHSRRGQITGYAPAGYKSLVFSLTCDFYSSLLVVLGVSTMYLPLESSVFHRVGYCVFLDIPGI